MTKLKFLLSNQLQIFRNYLWVNYTHTQDKEELLLYCRALIQTVLKNKLIGKIWAALTSLKKMTSVLIKTEFRQFTSLLMTSYVFVTSSFWLRNLYFKFCIKKQALICVKFEPPLTSKNNVIKNDVIGIRQKKIFDKYVTCDDVINPKIEFFIWIKTWSNAD